MNIYQLKDFRYIFLGKGVNQGYGKHIMADSTCFKPRDGRNIITHTLSAEDDKRYVLE